MQFNKSKSTKRFNFNISRDTKSHKSGANTVTITMTVKEAKAFQNFLNSYIDGKTSPTV